ncbi:MAG TPA: CbiX/SirB N-terminal domain-containing protein, partial [Roseiflexaceae bacterium]|nr:CbiX/SirB N-terminal domain-containing protein [Roseiflexaceae bacterium]
MIRLAARMEAAGMVAIAAAGFIEGCRPSVAEAVQHCLARGASEIIFQPYALLADEGMQRHIRLIRKELRNHVPAIPVRIGRPLGDHPALGQIVLQRANEADYAVAHAIAPLPLLLSYDGHMQRPFAAQITPFGNGAGREAWVPMYQRSPTGLVLIAEGARRAGSNWPLQAMCEWLRFHQRYQEVRLHLLAHGVEAFTGTIEHMLSQGIRNVVAVPYMLQMSKDDMAT